MADWSSYLTHSPVPIQSRALCVILKGEINSLSCMQRLQWQRSYNLHRESIQTFPTYLIFTDKSFQLGTNFPFQAGHSAPTESLLVLARVSRIDCLTSLAGYTAILGYRSCVYAYSLFHNIAELCSSFVTSYKPIPFLMEVSPTQRVPFFVQFISA